MKLIVLKEQRDLQLITHSCLKDSIEHLLFASNFNFKTSKLAP